MFKLHELLLSFFYFGKFPKAPGTFGSLIATLFWIAFSLNAEGLSISIVVQNISWLIFLLISFFYGCFATPIYSKKFNQVDHQTIVLDEVVGQIIALQISFIFIHKIYFDKPSLIFTHLFISFILFRFFDIKKPSIVGWADRIKSGFGVMLDDLFAGIFAGIISAAIVYVISYITT